MAQALKPNRRRTPPPRAFGTEREAPAVRRINYGEVSSFDIYYRVLTIGWLGFFAVVALCYVAFNLVFAGLYLLQPGAIANARPGSFTDAFFFSVQTMATIGYGQLAPQTLYANLLVAVEVLLGMSGLALATGVIFARFSRPRARVMFSRVAVITPYDGVPTLMFRAANQRRDQILEAQVTVSLLRDETTKEGGVMRRFQDLTLSRSRTPMFGLTWTVMHPIDMMSPLHGITPQSLSALHAEIVVVLTGLDASYGQTVHARHSYVADEILWDRQFADVLSQLEDGTRVIDYRRFHEVVEHAK